MVRSRTVVLPLANVDTDQSIPARFLTPTPQDGLGPQLFADWDVRVFGSDISRRVLAIARKGIYGRPSIRTTDERVVRRYFREVEGKHQVRDELRARVSFGQINLYDEAMAALVGEVDVIFCRNVLIYFDPVSRKQVIDTLYRKLGKGGYLLLGHSESLLHVTTAFELVHLEHDMVYRKPK